MNKEEIATTYEEYKNGFELVAGLGRLSCYQGLDYLEKLLEKDKFYSEELEDTIVFIESHINRIEKENKELKEQLEQINKMIEKCGFVNIEQIMLNYCSLLSQQKEFIDYLTSYIELLNNKPDLIEEGQQDILKEVFDKFKEIKGELK